MALNPSRQVFIIRMIDGKRILDIDNSALTWSTRLNKSGTIGVDIRISAAAVSAEQLRDFTSPKKYGLALSCGDTILEAGHITGRTYSEDGGTISLTASGLWTYLEWVKLFSYTFNRATGDPKDDVLAMSGMTYAGIARKIIRDSADNATVAEYFPPIITESDYEIGDRSQTYYGKDFVDVAKRLHELTEQVGGPDQGFYPEFTDGTHQAIQWRHRAGTQANPLLMQSGLPHILDTTVPRSLVTSLGVDEDGSTIATRIWTNGTGEGQGITTGSNDILVTGGYPLLEASQDIDSGVRALQQEHTDQALLEASTTTSTWTVSARIDPAAVRPGDFARVYVRGHNAIPDGERLVRIVGLDGDAKETVKVSLLPMLTDWDHFDPNRVQRHYIEPDPIRAENEARSAPAPAPSFSGGSGAGKLATIADPWGEQGQARVIFEGSTTPDANRYRYLDTYIPTPTDLVAMGAFGNDGELIILGRVTGPPVPPDGQAFPDAYLHRSLRPEAAYDNYFLASAGFRVAEPDDKGQTWHGIIDEYGQGSELTVIDPGTYEIEAQVTEPAFSGTGLSDQYGGPWRAMSLRVWGAGKEEHYDNPGATTNTAQTVHFSTADTNTQLTHYFKTTRDLAYGDKFGIQVHWNTIGLPGAVISPEASYLKIRRIA